MEILPIKTRKLNASPAEDMTPQPTLTDRLDTLSAALEVALDPDATIKSKADALKEVREKRKSDATAVKR